MADIEGESRWSVGMLSVVDGDGGGMVGKDAPSGTGGMVKGGGGSPSGAMGADGGFGGGGTAWVGGTPSDRGDRGEPRHGVDRARAS